MAVKNRYPREFKSEAINMAVNGDLSLSEIASNLGLNYRQPNLVGDNP